MNDSNKKSFVLYASYYEMMEDLNLEQKGYLLDCIFRYQLGEEVEIEDPLIRIIFKVIRKHFEMDNAKYEAKKAKYRENIEKRWKKTATSPTQQNTVSENNTQSNTVKYNRIQSNTTEYQSGSVDVNVDVNVNDNVDVNVNDNVDVNVNDNVNNIDKSIYVVDDKEKINKKESSDGYIADDAFFEDFFAKENEQFIEVLSMQTKCSIERLRTIAKEIQAEWRAAKQLHHRDFTDAFHHLRSHILIKAKSNSDKSRAAPEILQSDELTMKQQKIKNELKWKQQMQ